MSVVVSDTSPLHYLVLCGAPSVLPALFQKVVIPPTVFRELQQLNTPNARLNPDLVHAALERDKARKQAR